MADKPSSRFRLNETEVSRWVYSLKVFLIPLVIIYLTSVSATLSVASNIIEISDFIPNEMTRGAIALYGINGLLDIARKFLGGSK